MRSTNVANAANTTPAVKDHIIDQVLTLTAGTVGLPYVNTLDAMQIVKISWTPEVAYIASNACTLQIGKPGSDTYFKTISLGTAAIAVGVVTDIALGTNVVLEAGVPLQVKTAAVGGQSGRGRLIIRLRPQYDARQVASRPSGSADATV